MKDERTRRRNHKSSSSSQIQKRNSRDDKSGSDPAEARRKDRKNNNMDQMKTNNRKHTDTVQREESSSPELSHSREMSSHERSQSRHSNGSSWSLSCHCDHASHLYIENNTEHLSLTELSKSVNNYSLQFNKLAKSESENIIPEFDPMFKGQTIQMWLNKVDECARFYKLSEDQIIHYALLKLRGAAKSYYETQPSILYSWAEWKVKLIDIFSIDYAELLNEMLSKKAQHYESLQMYYYEKIGLLNACEITGKNAVDCLLHGIEDYNVRIAAEAAQLKQPEQVLKYFQSISPYYSVEGVEN